MIAAFLSSLCSIRLITSQSTPRRHAVQDPTRPGVWRVPPRVLRDMQAMSRFYHGTFEGALGHVQGWDMALFDFESCIM